jgi:hypothetical protein
MAITPLNANIAFLIIDLQKGIAFEPERSKKRFE